MSYQEFRRQYARMQGCTIDEAEHRIKVLSTLLQHCLKRNGIARLPGFGVFVRRSYKHKVGAVKTHTRITFRAAQALREAL